MGNNLLCFLGFHNWNRATFISESSSNVFDWRQRCERCNKFITWVQPKGINKNFYPVSWIKRRSLAFWIIILVALYFIYKYYFVN